MVPPSSTKGDVDDRGDIKTGTEPHAVSETSDGTLSTTAEASEDRGYTRIYKQSLVGLILGGSCGVAYGMMDSWGTKEGRRADRFSEAAKNMRTNGIIFGGSFAVFQAAKEATRRARGTKRSDPFDPENTAWASLSIFPMALHPVSRRAMPHMAFLICIDAVNEAGIKLY